VEFKIQDYSRPPVLNANTWWQAMQNRKWLKRNETTRRKGTPQAPARKKGE